MRILQSLRTLIHGKPAPAPAEPTVDELSARIGDRDGYVREAALKRAAELASPTLLPAIVERLNDWVPQVRALAQKVLLDMLPALDTADALRLLPAVQHLRQAGRADHSAWIASFERALVEKAGARAIVDGLLDPDVRVARACWKVTEAAGLSPPEAVIARLLPASRDIVLAQHAAESIFHLPLAARGPLFRRALESGFGMVRAIALRPVLAEESAENDALARRMATDTNNWVRLIASAYLARRGIDTAAILAAALRAEGAGSTTIRASLAGLAELGASGQLDLVRAHTGHPLARVQVSAYLAWLRLEPSRRDEIAREVLRSPLRRVRKLVLHLLRKDGACLDTETGLAAMAVHDDLDLMFAFLKGQPWSWLELIVRLEPRSRREPALRARLAHELQSWLGDPKMRYVQPSAAQRALFRTGDAVKSLSALLSKDEAMMAQRLKFELGEA